MEERMEKIKENNTEKRHSQKRAGGYAIRFFGCWLLTVALAVGMFLFWIYLSFEMRLSAEVIRAGLMVLYILPCFLGARMVRRRKTLDIEQLQLTIPLMCTLSGVAGVLRLGRNTNKS